MARNENHIETEKTIGSEIVAGLTELCETVERGESLDAKFTVRTVGQGRSGRRWRLLDLDRDRPAE